MMSLGAQQTPRDLLQDLIVIRAVADLAALAGTLAVSDKGLGIGKFLEAARTGGAAAGVDAAGQMGVESFDR